MCTFIKTGWKSRTWSILYKLQIPIIAGWIEEKRRVETKAIFQKQNATAWQRILRAKSKRNLMCSGGIGIVTRLNIS